MAARSASLSVAFLQPHDTHPHASGPSTLKRDHLAGGASRLAALLLP